MDNSYIQPPTPEIPNNPVDPVYQEFQRLVNGDNPDTIEWSALDWFRAGTLYKLNIL
jgi:hypothetical protein